VDDLQAGYKFESPTEKTEMTFSDFYDLIKQTGQGNANKYYYLQNSINEGVTQTIVDDFKQFDWDWIYFWQKKANWGQLKFNTLWAGMKDVYSHLHYDEAANFFGQIYGKKKWILYSPADFDKLYCYPRFHAADRQSQVDINNPDFDAFPKFKEAKAYTLTLHPGEVLFLPSYWFHHVISLDPTISINFWFELGKVDSEQLKLPLSPGQKVAVARNIEKMLGQVVGPREVGNFLKGMCEGRFDNFEFEDSV